MRFPFAVILPLSGILSLAADSGKEPLLAIDFDSPIRIGQTRKDNPLPENGYREGRFGKGYCFERPAVNFLPRPVALPESAKGFRPGAGSSLSIANAALSLRGASFSIPEFETDLKQETVFPRTALTISCEVKGPRGAQVTVSVHFAPWKATDAQKEKILAGSRKKEPFSPDSAGSKTYRLTGEWQRIAAFAETDGRCAANRTASVEMILSGAEEASFRHFQAEQTMRHPYRTHAPTSWLPGRNSRPAGSSGLCLTDQFLQQNFPINEGTAALYAFLPEEPGFPRANSPFFGFGQGWRKPMWQFRPRRFEAGASGAVSLKKELPSNRWIHLAVTWDKKESCMYVDGKLWGQSSRQNCSMEGREKCVFSIGKTLWPEESADAVLDEFLLFGRVLPPEEIAQLAFSNKPFMPPAGESFRIAPFSVHPFFRDDPNAGIPLEIYAGNEGKIRAELESFERITKEFSLKQGWNRIHLPFHPDRRSPGKGLLRITLYDGNGKKIDAFSAPYEVRGAVRRDLVRILSWGGDGETPLEYLQKLGINAVNTSPGKWEEEATRLGMLVNFDFRNHKELQKNNFDVLKTLQESRNEIHRMRGRYNWYGTLLNSEAYGAWGNFSEWKTKYPVLLDHARKSLGFDPPFDLLKLNPMSCRREDTEFAKDESGIYEKTGRAYRFLDWYVNEGHPVIALNNANAKAVREADPQNLVWTEPGFSAGIFRQTDMGGAWAYLVTLQEVAGKLRREWGRIRSAGRKYFQPTLTMYYWINSREKGVLNGKEYFRTRSVDELKADCWAAIGMVPMHDLCFFNAYAWYDAENTGQKFLPGQRMSDEFGRFMKQEFYPSALLLRDMEEPPARVALFVPEAISFYSEKSWEYYRTMCMWERNLALYNIHFDVVYSASLTQRALEDYSIVILPMASKISRELHERLLALASKVRIVADNHCKREYPGLLRLNYTHNPGRPYDQKTFENIFPFLKELEVSGTGRSFRAEGKSGNVMYFERMYKGVRFLLVVNNHWTTGFLSRCAADQSPRGFEYRPYGVSQPAVLTIFGAADSVIYDFSTGRKVPFRKEGNHVVFETVLGPGGGKLFCVYPSALSRLEMTIPKDIRRGETAAFRCVLTDETGKNAPGRQIFRVDVTDADDRQTDDGGWHVMEDGILSVPVRIGSDAPCGTWKITVSEHTSALTSTHSFSVR